MQSCGVLMNVQVGVRDSPARDILSLGALGLGGGEVSKRGNKLKRDSATKGQGKGKGR